MSRLNPRFRRNNPPLPPLAPGNGVVMYRILGSIEGQLTINTFTYVGANPSPTTAQLSTLLTNISTPMFASYKACLSADWTCIKERLDVVHRNDIVGVQSVVNNGVVGGRPALHEPSEVAIVINRTSSVKGQHGRGRVSLPAVSTADVTASLLTSAAITTALNSFTAVMLGTATDGVNTFSPCVGQRGTVSPHLIVGTSVLKTALFSTLLGTIRRRKIGRGK